MDSALSRIQALSRKLECCDAARCKVCGGAATPFDAVDFLKHCSGNPYYFGFSGVAIPYFRCVECDFTYTSVFDDWSHEEFKSLIYNDEYVKVDPDYSQRRPIENARHIATYLRGFNEASILDFGSGAGVFREEMRKHGFFDVEEYDPFSHPQAPSAQSFDVITCFEVIEHSPEPLSTVRAILSMLKPGGIVIFSQAFQPADFDSLKCSWWYAAPRNGHVSLFSERTFSLIALQLGAQFHRGPDIYALVKDGERTEVASAALGRLGCELHASSEPGSFSETLSSCFGAYRWTQTEEIVWRDRFFAAGGHLIIVPYYYEIKPGFSNACMLVIGERTFPTRYNRWSIMVSAHFETELTVDIRLSTPGWGVDGDVSEPLDHRRLGLAIPETLSRV